ncbi:Pre-rRNA-processing protein TSR2 [Sphaceloma murrayae]|uniref:Pre-rRNA-processing protein TSR2 n=1 Tax=Sphaceloma murrayae TaxID=2082308 RepID=A0A2K1QIX5_9PEZI|nr:Pre-rRNA-processing protein TSR2 [Sphaceloma murrayae]
MSPSTSLASTGPVAVPSSSSSATHAPPSQPDLQTVFDHTLHHLLVLWPALSTAVAEQWGGPDSSDKRDWLAGRISELFDERPETDALDLEDVLLQVMADEFEVNLDDDSEVGLAREIMRLRAEVGSGEMGFVREVRARMEKRGATAQMIARAGGQGEEGESSDEEEDEEGEDDTEMGDAPALVERREKVEPEVDEEGFTMVKKKGRR